MIQLITMAVEAPVDTTAKAFGGDHDTFGETVKEANQAGLIKPWRNLAGRDVITLTPQAAELYDIKIANKTVWARSEGYRTESRWISRKLEVKPSGADVTHDKAERYIPDREDKAAVDPAKGTVLSETIEEMMLRTGNRPSHPASLHELRQFRKHLPEQFILMGIGSIWTNVNAFTSVCPICENKPLSTLTYCTRCDRCGIDDLLDVASSKPKAKRLA